MVYVNTPPLDISPAYQPLVPQGPGPQPDVMLRREDGQVGEDEQSQQQRAGQCRGKALLMDILSKGLALMQLLNQVVSEALEK